MGAKLVGYREMKVPLSRHPAGHPDKWALEVYAHRTGLVEVWIDFDALMDSAGYKAMKNRNKSSVLGNGAIVLVARGCRDKPVES
jgi:hypothetical protein